MKTYYIDTQSEHKPIVEGLYHAEKHYDGRHWFVEKGYGDEAITVVDELTKEQAISITDELNNK